MTNTPHSRLEACLKLANDPRENPHERAAARAAAVKLMRKYHLTEGDVRARSELDEFHTQWTARQEPKRRAEKEMEARRKERVRRAAEKEMAERARLGDAEYDRRKARARERKVAADKAGALARTTEGLADLHALLTLARNDFSTAHGFLALQNALRQLAEKLNRLEKMVRRPAAEQETEMVRKATAEINAEIQRMRSQR